MLCTMFGGATLATSPLGAAAGGFGGVVTAPPGAPGGPGGAVLRTTTPGAVTPPAGAEARLEPAPLSPPTAILALRFPSGFGGGAPGTGTAEIMMVVAVGELPEGLPEELADKVGAASAASTLLGLFPDPATGGGGT